LPEYQSPDLCINTDQHAEGNDYSRPDDWTKKCSHPSYQGHDDDVPGPNPVQGLGKHIVQEEPVERPGHCSVYRRNDKGEELIPSNVVTNHLSSGLILPDRLQDLTKMRMDESVFNNCRKDKYDGNEIVEVERLKNRNRKQARNSDHIPGDPGQTILTTGKALPAGGNEEEHLPKGNREHGEIDPRLADDQKSDQDGRHRGEGDPEKHSQ